MLPKFAALFEVSPNETNVLGDVYMLALESVAEYDVPSAALQVVPEILEELASIETASPFVIGAAA